MHMCSALCKNCIEVPSSTRIHATQWFEHATEGGAFDSYLLLKVSNDSFARSQETITSHVQAHSTPSTNLLKT